MKNMLKKLLIGLAIAHSCASTTTHANITLPETSTLQMAGGAVILYVLGKTVVTGVLSIVQTHLDKRHRRSLSQQEQQITAEIHQTELQIAELKGQNSIFRMNLEFFRTMYANSVSSTQSSTTAPQFDEVVKPVTTNTSEASGNESYDVDTSSLEVDTSSLRERALIGALKLYAWFK